MMRNTEKAISEHDHLEKIISQEDQEDLLFYRSPLSTALETEQMPAESWVSREEKREGKNS